VTAITSMYITLITLDSRLYNYIVGRPVLMKFDLSLLELW